MTFPRPQSVREARPARQKTLLHVQGGGAPADTKKGMKSRHALPIVRRGLASAAQAGLLTRDRRREKASPRSSRIDPVTFGAVSPSQRRDRAGFSPASLFAGIRAGTCASSIRLCRCSRFPEAASRSPGRGRFIIPQVLPGPRCLRVSKSGAGPRCAEKLLGRYSSGTSSVVLRRDGAIRQKRRKAAKLSTRATRIGSSMSLRTTGLLNPFWVRKSRTRSFRCSIRKIGRAHV